jgi:hypothetical protein
MSQGLRDGAIGMLTAGMSTRYISLTETTSNVVFENLTIHPTGLTTADHVYGVVWASSLLMSTEEGGGDSSQASLPQRGEGELLDDHRSHPAVNLQRGNFHSLPSSIC